MLRMEKKCLKITRCETSLVDELHSSQEEADTRILLHAKRASDHGYNSVVVVSEDTGVYYCKGHQGFLSSEKSN